MHTIAHQTGHFARELDQRGTQRLNRRREGVDWTNHSEDEDYALMACNSSDSETKVFSCSNKCKESYANLKNLYDAQREQLNDASIEIKAYSQDAQKEKEDLKAKVEKWHNSSKNLCKLLNTQMSANDKFGLGYGDHRYDGILSYENEVLQSVFMNKESDLENQPLNDRFAEGMHAVPPPMIGNYMPTRPEIEIDYSYTEPSELVSEPVVIESNVESQPKVWSDAPIIEEYESDSDDEHMTGNKAYLDEFQDFNGGPVAFGGSKGYKTGKGKIKTGKLDFEDLPDENQVLLKIPRQNNMYSFNLENIVPTGGLACLIAKATTDESNKWHRRLGHVNFKNLNKLVKGNLVRGLPSKIFQNDHTCVACQKGKQHKASCKVKLVSSISQTLQLLHMDLFGPTSVRSLNHKTYCLVITDDFSRFSWVFFLRTKDETSAILKDFIRQIENQLNQKVKTIRSDNGTEFKNKEVIEFCGIKGIKREYSNARTPQQNGVAERKNMTLIEAARTMLADSFLPNTFWAEAVRKGPTWLFDLDYLTDSMNYHPVSSENQANLHAGQQEANQNAGTEETIDVGDSDKEDDSTQDCFVLPIWPSYSSTNTPAVTTDDKRAGPREEEQVFMDDLERLKKQEKEAYEEAEVLRKKFETLVIKEGVAKPSSTNIFSTVSTPAKASSTNPLNTASIPVSTASPYEGLTLADPTHSEEDDSEIPPLEDIYQNSTDGIFTTSSFDDEGAVADFTNLETVVNVSPIPTSRIHSTHPRALILGDPNSAVQTRSKVNTSSGAHAFVSYVQKQKRTNHKDFHHCLFACFLSQQEPKKISEALEDESWVDAMQEELLQFEIQKVWVLVDLPYGKKAIGKRGYRNKKDVKEALAYLYGKLMRSICVLNTRFSNPKTSKKVYKVVKALYGLHQAPRAWYATLSTFLLKNGYRRGTIDKTLFLKKDKNDIILVQVYVDDIIFGSTKKSWCDEFEALMKSRFQMSSMGELTFFLGLQVKQKEDGIFISQDKYVAEILKKFDFVNVKNAVSPNCRPEACSQGMRRPKIGFCALFYLESYSDSDYAGANLDRKSTTGGCQFLGRRLISWQCKKQTIVATSTTEAEYVAAASCCGQVLWIQNQMLDYGFNFMNTKIYIDNESTICIVKNPVYHSKTKHIAIRHHFIRDAYEKKLIQVLKIHTDDNVADLLTKAFDVSRGLKGFRELLSRATNGTEALLLPTLFFLWLDKHNMVAYLEKSEGNEEFHEIIDFLKRSSIHFALTKGKHFSGKVTPLFASMLVQPTQDEGASSERPSEALPTPSPAPTSEVPYEPQTDSSPAQTSEVPIEHQPNPSPRPSPTNTIPASIPETSGDNLGGHSSSDKSLSGNEGDMTIQGVYDLCLSLCKQVSDQAKEIQALKAQITKLKKQAKPVIKHHKAYLKSVSLKQRFPRKSFSKKHRVHKEYVSKQGRKFAKGESSVQRDPLFDEMPEDKIDHMETENAQSEGRTREMVDEDKEIDEARLSTEDEVSTVKEGVSTDFEKLSTDRPIVSTDGSKVSTDMQVEGAEEQVKGTDALKEGTEEHNESTEEQREGTEEKVESTDGQPLPKIDPKDKGKKKIEEEDESESESDGIPQAEKKFKQLESDEELARKIQEEWEAEEERNRIAEEKAANEELIRDFDDMKARIEADRLLAEKLQEQEREQFTIEERAKFLHDTIAAQRKFLAQQRSEAIRNKPPTKNQLRNQMMTYLKHVGNYKHAELKIKKFEEVQALYEKIKRSDEDFISILGRSERMKVYQEDDREKE
ncbi:putative ribonuclease H-like domain-containing protein [Tanacetum coccineum]